MNNDKIGWQPWLLETIKMQGVSTVLLGIIVYGIWNMIGWSADNLVTPLVSKQIQMMNTIEESSRVQAESIKLQNQLIDSLNANSMETNITSKRIEDAVNNSQTALLQLIKNLESNISK